MPKLCAILQLVSAPSTQDFNGIKKFNSTVCEVNQDIFNSTRDVFLSITSS